MSTSLAPNPEKTINGPEKTFRLNRIYEQSYKIGNVLKSIYFEAGSDAEADEKSTKYIRFLGSLMTAKVIKIGIPKKFAIDVDEEMDRLRKLVDAGKNPFY